MKGHKVTYKRTSDRRFQRVTAWKAECSCGWSCSGAGRDAYYYVRLEARAHREGWSK